MKIEMDCISQEDLIHALTDRHSIQASDNAVQICGYSTGHTVSTIAFCKSVTHAEVLATALRQFVQSQVDAAMR